MKLNLVPCFQKFRVLLRGRHYGGKESTYIVKSNQHLAEIRFYRILALTLSVILAIIRLRRIIVKGAFI